jgi:hypothetical protein
MLTLWRAPIGRPQGVAMSRHIPRHDRWSQHGPNEYRSGDAVVRFEKGAWWAVLSYRQRPDDEAAPQGWRPRCDHLGPFKRPRNAMIAAEDRLQILKRRHGDRVAIDSPGLRS